MDRIFVIGYGHVYQGRFKSFPIEADEHFYQVLRYVERSPWRADLVRRAEDWRRGSIWIREHETVEQKAGSPPGLSASASLVPADECRSN